MDERFSYSNTSNLLNLVKLCLLPVFSQLCDAAGFMGIQCDQCYVSDNYTAAAFVYYNTGNKEIAGVNVRLNPYKMFSGEKMSGIVFDFLQRYVRQECKDHQFSSCGCHISEGKERFCS